MTARHTTTAVVGSSKAITRCTCGWTSRTYRRNEVQQARQEAADHVLDSIQGQLPLEPPKKA